MDLQNKIISLEGLDCSFKETNTKYICELLSSMNIKNKLYSFPTTQSESSILIKKYLQGQISSNAEDINAYTASLLYTIDRAYTYITEIKRYYKDGYTIVFDRYTGSNCIYQSVKINDPIKRKEFINWIIDTELNKCELPKPDITIFMRTPFEVSMNLMKNKEGADIHELNIDFQTKVYNNADEICKLLNWKIIECTKDSRLLSKEEIANKIKDYLLN